jgi:hypothetical protein
MKRSFLTEVLRGLATNVLLIGIVFAGVGIDVWVHRFHI